MVRHESNYQKQLAPDVELFLPCRLKGFEHYRIGNMGTIINDLTGHKVQYSYQRGNPVPLVWLQPAKGIKGNQRGVRVGKLIYETHKNVSLPDKTPIEYLDNNPKNNRLNNLDIPDNTGAGKNTEYTRLVTLPPVVPEVKQNGEIKQNGHEIAPELLTYLKERLEYLQLMLTDIDNPDTLAEFVRADLHRHEIKAALTGMSNEDIVNLIVVLRNAAKGSAK